MGWLPWTSSSSSNNNTTSDGGRIAPDRTSRQRCWESRDLFFGCLDNNNIVDSLKDDKEARKRCGKEILEFENACSKTWVIISLSFLLGILDGWMGCAFNLLLKLTDTNIEFFSFR